MSNLFFVLKLNVFAAISAANFLSVISIISHFSDQIKSSAAYFGQPQFSKAGVFFSLEGIFLLKRLIRTPVITDDIFKTTDCALNSKTFIRMQADTAISGDFITQVSHTVVFTE